MTTKAPSAPWADEPFALIPTPSNRLDISRAHVWAATEMAHVHNTLIRGLNALLLQAPHVPVATEEGYVEKDVKDLLFFVRAWTKMVHHHHSIEETFMFPELEKFSGKPGLMANPIHEHELFHDGFEKLMAYAADTKPQDYRWEGPDGMKSIIDSFSKPLIDHLYAEIDVFLALEGLDEAGLRKIWAEAEKIAQQSSNLSEVIYDIFPLVLGCSDKTYEGAQNFPPLPFIMPYMVKYWFGSGNGAWRFLPCDFWGKPQPLTFGPAARS